MTESLDVIFQAAFAIDLPGSVHLAERSDPCLHRVRAITIFFLEQAPATWGSIDAHRAHEWATYWPGASGANWHWWFRSRPANQLPKAVAATFTKPDLKASIVNAARATTVSRLSSSRLMVCLTRRLLIAYEGLPGSSQLMPPDFDRRPHSRDIS